MIKKILEYLNLENETVDRDIIHDQIEKDSSFRGTNLWILVLAIFVASVGLNTNSTAVIIGAMLISPLMGPINGMGYSVATYNFPLFKTALKNFSFAVLASLIASTIYFTISPLSAAHSELLARTSPSIYDVLIAFFGGLAGIIAISTTQKGNVLPGVAIATALMPPLCTAGYGLATRQYEFFLGAFYLFTINTVFIALASALICQFLDFPIRTSIEEKRKRKINHIISLIILITVIPSFYFGYKLVENEKFTERSKKFIESIAIFEGNYLLKNKINAPEKTLTLGFAGNLLDKEYKMKIYKKAKDFGLDSTNIVFQKALTFSKEKELSQSEDLQSEVNRLKAFIEAKKKTNDSLAQIGNQLLKEIKAIYPDLEGCAFAKTEYFTTEDTVTKQTHLVTFTSKHAFSDKEKQKIKEWLSNRLNSDEVKILIEKKDTK